MREPGIRPRLFHLCGQYPSLGALSYDSHARTTNLSKPACRHMNQHDLEAELERHHPAAFGWALSCCRWAREEAEDVLQASYLKMLDGRARFDGRSTFRTWLFGVIRRTAAEQRRRALASRLLGLRWLQGGEPPATAPNAVDELVQSE